jgi:dUTP pyrophosphatase
MKRRKRGAAALKVNVRRLPHAEDLPMPAYQTVDAAGFDLIAAVPADTPITLTPGSRALVPTGLIFQFPPGTEGQVRPRSGLAAKHGVTVLNSPGTVDADYRGEVAVILINLGSETFVVNRGDRIAQMIVAPLTRVELRENRSLSSTKRGEGGFGSTGIGGKQSSFQRDDTNEVAAQSRDARTKSSAPHPRRTKQKITKSF